jgi:hypothetical protein
MVGSRQAFVRAGPVMKRSTALVFGLGAAFGLGLSLTALIYAQQSASRTETPIGFNVHCEMAGPQPPKWCIFETKHATCLASWDNSRGGAGAGCASNNGP